MNTKKENDKNLDKLDSMSKRLKYLVDTLGVKQSHMAQKLGVSPSGLHYILNNDVKFSKNAKKIAEYLNVNEQWLSTGQGEIYEENTSIKTYKIPIYYPDQLKLFYQSGQQHEIKTNNFLLTTEVYSNKTIAIYNTETNFSPKFEFGDIIAFEHVGTEFKSGEILLAYLAQTNRIVLKHGFSIEGKVILLSSEGDPLILKESQGDIIIGAYRECQKKSHSP